MEEAEGLDLGVLRGLEALESFRMGVVGFLGRGEALVDLG